MGAAKVKASVNKIVKAKAQRVKAQLKKDVREVFRKFKKKVKKAAVKSIKAQNKKATEENNEELTDEQKVDACEKALNKLHKDMEREHSKYGVATDPLLKKSNEELVA